MEDDPAKIDSGKDLGEIIINQSNATGTPTKSENSEKTTTTEGASTTSTSAPATLSTESSTSASQSLTLSPTATSSTTTSPATSAPVTSTTATSTTSTLTAPTTTPPIAPLPSPTSSLPPATSGTPTTTSEPQPTHPNNDHASPDHPNQDKHFPTNDQNRNSSLGQHAQPAAPDAAPSISATQDNKVPIIVGSTLGIVACCAIAVMFIWHTKHKRKREDRQHLDFLSAIAGRQANLSNRYKPQNPSPMRGNPTFVHLVSPPAHGSMRPMLNHYQVAPMTSPPQGSMPYQGAPMTSPPHGPMPYQSPITSQPHVYSQRQNMIMSSAENLHGYNSALPPLLPSIGGGQVSSEDSSMHSQRSWALGASSPSLLRRRDQYEMPGTSTEVQFANR